MKSITTFDLSNKKRNDMTTKEYLDKLALLLTHKKSKFKLDATKKDLAVIALKLFMEREGYLDFELEQAITDFQEYVKDKK